MTASIELLKKRKQQWLKYFEDLENTYREGKITKQEYLDTQHTVLKGKFKEDFLRHIDDEIEHQEAQRSNKKNIKVVAATLAFFILAFAGIQGGITGFITFGDTNLSTLPINNEYTTNTTEDLSFITTTSLRASGKIYGQGQTWIYLIDNETERLVYYADTRTSTSLTGLVIGERNENNATPLNETNQIVVSETVTGANATIINQTVNATISNSTINKTNTTINETVNITATNETVVNQTNTTQEPTVEEVVFSISTNKDTYSLGETVSIVIRPSDGSYTLYLHAPSESYILNDLLWTIEEPGNHTVTTLVTYEDQTERVTKDFYVRSAFEEETTSFQTACVETCVLQETPVNLRIVTSNTRLKLESITYNPISEAVSGDEVVIPPEAQAEPNSTSNITIVTPSNTTLDCSNPDPNKRPLSCLQENAEIYFKPQPIYLEDLDRKIAARITPIGNLLITGDIVENSFSVPTGREFKVIKADGLGNEEVKAWISSLTGNLHLQGRLYEENVNLQVPKGAFSIQNSQSVTVAYFDRDTGDLYIRGNLIPFRRNLGGES